ncbi:hypothetical protein [Streptomyces sp.]|uniref:hypothetical protein n=1 Tax=Streptomyces sp. TaxID=1931 RepID=UPI002D78996C|nr:hypothetical protein [Streptomyces sp.]HET6356086.1 hypothetical protein [Streptomyces sp.]
MSGWDDRSGPRPDMLCPLCGEPVYYTGDVETTKWGDSGRSRVPGLYKCVNPECHKYEQQVDPRPR